MKISRITLVSCLSLTAFLPALCLADSTVVLHVDVQNPPTDTSIRIPAPGDYTFSVSQKKAQVTLPSGAILILDFDKKVVSTLDPKQLTFSQVKMDDYLSLGDKVSSAVGSRFSAKTTVAFEPTVGQDGKPIMGVPTTPYSLDVEALISSQSRSSGSHGGGHRGLGSILGGGGIFGGGGSSSGGENNGGYVGSSSSGSNLSSRGCKLDGELWLTNSTVGDCDRTELSIAEACALMRCAPGVKGLTDKIKKANLTLMAANYSLSIYDSAGLPPLKSPTITFETKSTARAFLDAALFTIPNNYIKVDTPASPLGTKF